MNRVVIAESNPESLERLVAATVRAAASPVPVPSLDTAFDAVETHDASVLIVGPSLIEDSAFELSQHLSDVGRTTVIMVAQSVEATMMRRALRSGVSDVCAVSESLEDLAKSVERACLSSARARVSGASEPATERNRAKVLTVFSTKGGVGKTVLSTNLAVALADITGKRVALVDLDLEFGDVAIMLGIKPEHTIHDAVQMFDRLDSDMLAGLMERHVSGVDVLLAPVRPEDAEGISAARLGQVLDLVRENYDYVVVDTSPSFSEAVLAALDRSDEVYVMTMMDVASIKNTRISLQKLGQLGYDNGRVRLILNRSDSKVLLQPAEVEQAVGGSIAMHIPSDRVVPRSVNKGVPVVTDSPRSDVAKSILSIAKSAVAHAEPAKEVSNVA